jgi:hypothetical protein
MRGRYLAAVLVAPSLLFTTSCDTSTVVRNLQLVIQAAEIVLPLVLPLPQETKTTIAGYLSAVSKATNTSATLLADQTKPQEQKILGVTAAFSNAIAPQLPSGTPQEVVSTVGATAEAVANFLASLPPQPKARMDAMEVATPVVPVSRADVRALQQIKQRAEALQAKLY